MMMMADPGQEKGRMRRRMFDEYDMLCPVMDDKEQSPLGVDRGFICQVIATRRRFFFHLQLPAILGFKKMQTRRIPMQSPCIPLNS